ncbi:MAG: 3-oxoacyl-[acyl-carrier-protein] synthase 2 [Phycisphaerae bacterium]|nr:3-oxoacyl-[acyl-carrier-protein] synthase 2 [Phycisphaerae bacterium]
MDRRVVITGMGLATPLGLELEAVWAALLEGRSAIGPIRSFDAQQFHCPIGGELPEFSLGDYIPKAYRKSAKVMSRDIQIALVAAYQAVKHAGLQTKCLVERGEAGGAAPIDPARFGANIGAGLICADLNELAGALVSADEGNGQFSSSRWGSEGMNNLTPLWLLKFLPNMLACHVTIVHDCQAPSNTITCGEASSHLAIGEAYTTIQRGAADVCICGGAESKINLLGLLRPDLFGRLSRRLDDPAQACRPFDVDHDGMVVGEGGGLVILEELNHALARGARIYGEVVGFGASCNTQSWKEADSTGRSHATAIRRSLKNAGIAPSEVGLISAFGTGIPSYDDSEARALAAIFGEHCRTIPVFSCTGALGNNGAGNGAINLAMAVLAMNQSTVPPTVNTRQVHPDYPLRLAVGRPIDARIDQFVSLAYALSGGQTAAITVRRFQK